MSTTFSQFVDDIVQDLGRPNLKIRVSRLLNQTVRELHTNENGGSVLYARNLVEEQIEADVDVGFSWILPLRVQAVRAVRFDSVIDHNGTFLYATRVNPGPGLKTADNVYYQSGDALFFKGYGGIGAKISLAYYNFLPSLQYFDVLARPGIFDSSGVFIVDPAFGGTEQDARDLTTHWLLERWDDSVLYEGVAAKIFKGVDESNDRARSTFAAYQQMRLQLATIERAEEI